MNSILEAFCRLDKSEWNYYESDDLYNPFLTGNNHFDFIEKYFCKTGKLKEFPEDFKNMFDKKHLGRVEHTNSVFFLGSLLYSRLQLDDKIGKRLDKRNFLFIWFLTALAHDFGYKFENNFDLYKTDINSSTTLKTYFKIEHFILGAQLEEKNKVVKLYDQIEKYFEYRLAKCRLDHGIISGVVLFDSLVKHRCKMELIDREYNWEPSLEKDYASACLAICMHNIWNIDKEEQQKNGLDFSGIFPISFQDFPLLFILGVIDTIDPVKVFECKNTEDILTDILIDVSSQNEIILKKRDGSSLNFQRLIDKANGLTNWLAVKVCHSANELKIEILEV